MAHRPSPRAQLFFHVRAKYTGLDAREAGLLVDLQHLVQAPHVDAHDRALLVGLRLEGADDVGAAAERNEHGIRLDDGVHDLNDLALVGGVEHDVGDAPEVTATDAHQVAYALAVTVHDAGLVVVVEVLLTDDVEQLAAKPVVDLRRGHVEAGEVRLRRGGVVDVQPHHLLHEGAELRPPLVGVAEALLAPAPPFLLLHGLDHSSS